MSTLFSFGSWNVEHFRNDRDRIRENIEFIQEADPDVFAIYEVEGKDVFEHFVQLMPDHNFYITEGLSHMETLVGVRGGLTAFLTQRHKLKSDIPTLRPGTLVTLTIDDENYSLLFVHLKSADDPRSWGLRDDMSLRIAHLKDALDEAPGTPEEGARFIVVGDFNTMGMNLTYSDKDVSWQEELARYEDRLSRSGDLELLEKTAPYTWWGGTDSYPPSNLDHCFASENLSFQEMGDGAKVEVRGWPELEGEEEQKDWISEHSDHAMLYGEVLKG